MIGGEHYFQPPLAVDNSMAEMLEKQLGAVAFFSTGRDALYSLLASLPQTHILLPDLICQSVYHACVSAGKEVSYYKIGLGLIPEEGSLSTLQVSSCVLVLHYFGAASESFVLEAKSHGAVVISDVSHSLFNAVRLQYLSGVSHYLFGSLRKSGPFPDGGFLSSKYHSVVQPNQPVREDFFSLRTAGLFARGFAVREGFVNDDNFALLKKAEELLDHSQPASYGCSYLSRKLLQTIDVMFHASMIKRNMAVLSSKLENVCCTIEDRSALSPYFWCRFQSSDERDMVRNQLASHRVYCPVHWETNWLVSPSLLSGLSLSIPCDARYDEGMMLFISELIISCVQKKQ